MQVNMLKKEREMIYRDYEDMTENYHQEEKKYYKFKNYSKQLEEEIIKLRNCFKEVQEKEEETVEEYKCREN